MLTLIGVVIGTVLLAPVTLVTLFRSMWGMVRLLQLTFKPIIVYPGVTRGVFVFVVVNALGFVGLSTAIIALWGLL